MANFTFATTYQPGHPDATAFDVDITIPLLARTDHPQRAALRRLHFESFAVYAAEAKRMATRGDEDDRPRKLPAPERKARLDKLKKMLVGLLIEGELEPADGLVDKLVHMQETGVLIYLAWEELGRRDLEARGQKKEHSWVEDPITGVLRRIARTVDPNADISDMLKLRLALQRRGLGLEMARLMTYKVHELWAQHLFTRFGRDALPGYNKVSLDQLLNADKEMFAILADRTRGGLGMMANGDYRLDHMCVCH